MPDRTDLYTVDVVRELDSVLELRDQWKSMSVDPNADIDYFRTIVESRAGEVLRPHVIVLKRNGKVCTILAGRLEKKRFDAQLGYKRIHLASARCLTLIHGGLMGDQSESCVTNLVESVLEMLRNREAEVAWFYGVDVDSPFYRIGRKAGIAFTRDYCPGSIQRWKVKLPSTYKELHSSLSNNTKHNLKRYSKRLQSAFGDQLTIKKFSDVQDLDWILSDMEKVAAKSYHRGLGVGFNDNEETRRAMRLAADQSWLVAYVLYIGGSPCAFWNGILYRRTLFTSTTGYDPDIREYRPGTFLLQKMLEDLCKDKVADEIDFGFGDAQYKRDWCKSEVHQASFVLFAPTFKGICVNCLRTPPIVATNALRGILAKTDVLQRVKRVWRDRLAKKAKMGTGPKSSDVSAIPPGISPGAAS